MSEGCDSSAPVLGRCVHGPAERQGVEEIRLMYPYVQCVSESRHEVLRSW